MLEIEVSSLNWSPAGESWSGGWCILKAMTGWKT